MLIYLCAYTPDKRKVDAVHFTRVPHCNCWDRHMERGPPRLVDALLQESTRHLCSAWASAERGGSASMAKPRFLSHRLEGEVEADIIGTKLVKQSEIFYHVGILSVRCITIYTMKLDLIEFRAAHQIHQCIWVSERIWGGIWEATTFQADLIESAAPNKRVQSWSWWSPPPCCPSSTRFDGPGPLKFYIIWTSGRIFKPTLMLWLPIRTYFYRTVLFLTGLFCL